MANNNNLNQSVTLDASQFISATQQIATSVDGMNKSMASAAAAFTQFNSVVSNIDSKVSQLTAAFQANNASAQQMAAGIQSLNAAQGQMQSALTQIAISARASAVSLDQLATSGASTGRAVSAAGNSITLSWTSVIRLLAVTSIRRVFLDIVGGIKQATVGAAEFENSIGVILGLNQQLGDSADQLTEKFARTATAFNQSLGDVGKAGKDVIQTGVAQSSQDLDTITQEGARLAQITGTTTQQATQAITTFLQAFKKDASEARTVANQLFNLNQSGVGIQELGTAFGRVAAQAQRLGVSSEEASRLVELLKTRGLSSSEAITQVGQTLNSIERPTAQLTALFKELGFQNSQEAVQGLRLVGVLEKINQARLEGSATERQLLQSRRSGGALSVIQELRQPNPLDNLQGLNQTADAAQRNVAATTQWGTELNKIKTAFESEIAPAFMKAILDIFQSSGGLSKAIVDLGRNISTLAPIVANIINGFVIWGNGIAKLADVFGLINLRINESKAATEALNAAQRESLATFNQWESAQRQVAQQAIQRGQASVSDLFRPLNQQLTSQADVQRQTVTHLKEEYAGAAKAITSSMAAQINGLDSIARQAEPSIQESLKRVASFAEKTDQEAFQRQFRTAGQVNQLTAFSRTPQGTNQALNSTNLVNAQNLASQSQIDLVRQRIAKLTQEATALFKQGDDASVASARKKLEDVRKLNDQLFDTEAERSRRTADLRARVSGQNQTFNPFDRERLAAAEQLNAREASLEAQNHQRLTERAQLIDDITKKLREQLTVAEQSIRAVQSFSVTDRNGELQQKFRGLGGKDAALSEFDSRSEQARSALQTEIASATARIAELVRSGTISREQADTLTRRGPNAETLNRFDETRASLRSGLSSQFDTAAQMLQSQEFQRAANGFLQTIAKNTEAALQRASEARQEQQSLISQAQERVNTIRNGLPNNIGGNAETAELGVQLRSLIELVDRELRSAAGGNQAAIPRIVGISEKIEDVLNKLISSRLGQAGFEGQSPEGAALNNTVRQLTDTLRNRQVAENAVQGESQLGTGIVDAIRTAIGNPQTFQDASNAVEALSTALQSNVLPSTIGDVANQLNNSLIPAIQSAAAALQNVGSGEGNTDAPGFATGGLIGNRFASMGPDNVKINARAGEFVVNPQATRQFYSTLVAINRGDRPSGGGYSRGGTVSTHIGNMTFHVNGAEKPEHTAREVIKLIRREQRRGNV